MPFRILSHRPGAFSPFWFHQNPYGQPHLNRVATTVGATGSPITVLNLSGVRGVFRGIYASGDLTNNFFNLTQIVFTVDGQPAVTYTFNNQQVLGGDGMGMQGAGDILPFLIPFLNSITVTVTPSTSLVGAPSLVALYETWTPLLASHELRDDFGWFDPAHDSVLAREMDPLAGSFRLQIQNFPGNGSLSGGGWASLFHAGAGGGTSNGLVLQISLDGVQVVNIQMANTAFGNAWAGLPYLLTFKSSISWVFNLNGGNGSPQGKFLYMLNQ